MSIVITPTDAIAAKATLGVPPARALLCVILASATIVGFVATGADATSLAVAHSGDDLTRLLRAMAAIKAVVAAAAAAAILWRLGSPVSLPWFAAYAVAGAAMAAGPGLIWDLAHVGLGAALLHGGLLASVLLLWRDPVVGRRLGGLVAARRAALARTGC